MYNVRKESKQPKPLNTHTLISLVAGTQKSRADSRVINSGRRQSTVGGANWFLFRPHLPPLQQYEKLLIP